MKIQAIKDKRLVLAEAERPAAKRGEVVIEVRAAGVNRADILQKNGLYPPPPGAPEWPGLEVAGVVAETGEGVTKWRVGDKVCALLGGGGYAEYAATPEGMVMPIPEGMGFEEAAALPEAFLTAWLNLFIEGGAKAGDTLLMQAGASGLASVVIPLAKAFGVRVVTTVRTRAKLDAVAALGADRVVVLAEERLADALAAEAAAGHPVDIAIDCLGGAMVGECLPHVARGCRWIIIATLAGDVGEVNMRTMYVKGIRFFGSTLRARTDEMKAQVLEALTANVWPKIVSGELRPTIFKVLPFAEANEAHAILEEGRQVGKVVLKL